MTVAPGGPTTLRWRKFSRFGSILSGLGVLGMSLTLGYLSIASHRTASELSRLRAQEKALDNEIGARQAELAETQRRLDAAKKEAASYSRPIAATQDLVDNAVASGQVSETAANEIQATLDVGDDKRRQKAREAWHRGLANVNHHLDADAKKRFLQAISIDPKFPAPYRSLGLLQENAANPPKDLMAAKTFYEKALAVQPDYLPAMYNLASIELKSKSPDAAASIARRILDLNPKDPKATSILIKAQVGDRLVADPGNRGR